MKKKIFIASLVILVVVYFGGVFYFSGMTYPNTYVNDENKGLESKLTVFDPSKDTYKLLVKAKDEKSLEIVSTDIDMNTTISQKPELNQNQFLWPIQVFQKHDYKVVYDTNYNTEKLNDIIVNSDLLKNMVEPQDAKIEYIDDKFQIVKQVEGSKIDREALQNNIVDAIELAHTELVLDKEYEMPKVYDNDKELVEKLEKLTKLNNKKFVFDFVDKQWELKGEELFEMLEENGSEVTLNKDKLIKYVLDIANETDTYATSRTFNATGIGQIVVEGGIYGWDLDVRGTVDTILEMFKNNEFGEVEISYNSEGRIRNLADDVGDTYIEIDLSRQMLWLYVDGEIVVETNIVSGDSRFRATATPTGVNRVWSRETDKDLKGITELEGADYTYPVKYWMPIGWTGSGIHDAPPRKDWSKTAYHTNGSNSCINVPPAIMGKLFENTPYNTAVFVYESSTNYSPNEFEKQSMQRSGEARPVD